MNGHSILAPSSMARIVQCEGSLAMSALYPEPDDDTDSRDGTAAHWVFAELMAGRTVAEGQIAPNGVVLDDEMIDGAQLMVDTLQAADPGGWVIEQPVTIPAVHPMCWGTPDAYKWRVPSARLHVADFKFGHGLVEVFENWQLMAYAIGLLEPVKHLPGIIVHLTIVQPRCHHREGHVRTWSTTSGALRAYANIMASKAEAAMGATPATHTGPECMHCPGRHACTTLQRAGLMVCDVVGKTEPLSLTAEQAGQELRRLTYASNLLKARRTGLEQQVLSALRVGVRVSHWHIENGQGREHWKDPGQALAMGSLLGLPLAKPPAPITPSQARKLGLDTAGFTERLTGEAKLVADDPIAARKVFGA